MYSAPILVFFFSLLEDERELENMEETHGRSCTERDQGSMSCLVAVLPTTPLWWINDWEYISSIKMAWSTLYPPEHCTWWCEVYFCSLWRVINHILIKISRGFPHTQGKLSCHILSQLYKRRGNEDIHTAQDPLNSENWPAISTMKIFLLFLLTIVVVTAATHVPSASDKCKFQHVLLAEILEHVKGMEGKEINKVRYIRCVVFPVLKVLFKHE